MTSAPIIMYHAVGDGPDPLQVQVSPMRLRQQLGTLRRLGFRGVSVRELLDDDRRRGRRVGLTFDDGYADFHDAAMPILNEFNCTATVFVVADRIGGTNDWDIPPRRPLLDLPQLDAVHAAGHEIASHSLHHVNLAQVPLEEAERELAGSRQRLEDLTGRPVTGFCYPYGGISRATVLAAQRHYDYACAVHAPRAASRWALPRFFVGERDGALRLAIKIGTRRLRQRAHGSPW